MQFIQEFANRRFPPTQPALANPRASQAVSSSKPTSRTSSAGNSRSASPQSQAQSSAEIHEPNLGQSFSNEQNIYRKKDVEDNYFVGWVGCSAVLDKGLRALYTKTSKPAREKLKRMLSRMQRITLINQQKNRQQKEHQRMPFPHPSLRKPPELASPCWSLKNWLPKRRKVLRLWIWRMLWRNLT